MALYVLLVLAQQKIFFMAARLEQLDQKLVGRRFNSAGGGGDCLVARLRFRADEIDYADKQQTKNAHRAQ